MFKVFINPGHDLELDPGAINPDNGLKECDVAAAIGKLVAEYLDAAGCEVKILQADELDDVVDASNDWPADLFVSIHCNSAENRSARGAETFSYPGEGTDGHLAECIQKQMIDSIDDLWDRGVKTARFYVLTWTDCPAVLVETAFISNDEDTKLLMNNQDDFARAIARGVTDYITEVGKED